VIDIEAQHVHALLPSLAALSSPSSALSFLFGRRFSPLPPVISLPVPSPLDRFKHRQTSPTEMAPPARFANVDVPSRPLPAVPAGSVDRTTRDGAAARESPSRPDGVCEPRASTASTSRPPQSPAAAADRRGGGAATPPPPPPRRPTSKSRLPSVAGKLASTRRDGVRGSRASTASTSRSPRSPAAAEDRRGGGAATPPPPPPRRPTSEPLLPAVAPTLASTSTDRRSLADLVAASEVPSPDDDAEAAARAAARARRRAAAAPDDNHAVAVARARSAARVAARAAAAARCRATGASARVEDVAASDRAHDNNNLAWLVAKAEAEEAWEKAIALAAKAHAAEAVVVALTAADDCGGHGGDGGGDGDGGGKRVDRTQHSAASAATATDHVAAPAGLSGALAAEQAAAGRTPPSVAVGGAAPSLPLDGGGGGSVSTAPSDRPRKPFSGPSWGTWMSRFAVRVEERRVAAARRLAVAFR